MSAWKSTKGRRVFGFIIRKAGDPLLDPHLGSGHWKPGKINRMIVEDVLGTVTQQKFETPLILPIKPRLIKDRVYRAVRLLQEGGNRRGVQSFTVTVHCSSEYVINLVKHCKIRHQNRDYTSTRPIITKQCLGPSLCSDFGLLINAPRKLVSRSTVVLLSLIFIFWAPDPMQSVLWRTRVVPTRPIYLPSTS
jgi:hypothetical protein